MMKRTLSIIISFVMMATMVSMPTGVFAEENAGEEVTKIGNISAVHINPLYEDVIDESDIPLPKKSSSSARSVGTVSEENYLTSKEDVAAILRDEMKKRQTTIELYYKIKTDEYDGTAQFLYDIFDEAVMHTKVPTEGDYLRWQYGGWSTPNIPILSDGEYYFINITYNILFYTTATQEARVDAAAEKILAELDLNGKCEYLKSKIIYDYICEKVKYDHDRLNDTTYKLKHTAYAAFIDKIAVCQGYALMFYRLALEAGLDARIVAGDAYDSVGTNIGAHGWNIVKVGNLYYNLDSTWDADATPTVHNWFLKAEGKGNPDNAYDSFDETHVYVTHNTQGIAVNPTLTLSDYSRDTSDYVHSETDDISSWNAYLEYASVAYDGTEKIPEVTIKGLIKDKDFTVSYSNNTKHGTATVTITGTGNYTGTITKNFDIVEVKDINQKKDTVNLENASYTYDGTAKTPKVTIPGLAEGTDFTVEYADNTNVGTATVIIKGKGSYTGTITKEFAITKADQTITGSVAFNKVYGDGIFSLGAAAKGPLTYTSSAPVVATVSNDGKVTIKNAGKTTITISATATDFYNAATKTVNITVAPANVSAAKATLDKTSYTYTGSAIQPKVVSVVLGGRTLTKGTDFTVSYSNNTNIGTATVTIMGIGNYTGSLPTTFTIVNTQQTNFENNQTITKTDQTITGASKFSKVYGNKAFSLGASAKGKLTYKSSNSKIAAVSSTGKVTIKNTGRATITISAAATSTHNAAVKKVTINISPKKVSSLKAKSSKKKTAVISWKQDKKATGYEITYSTDKKFKKSVKKVNISKNKTVKKTVSKLKSKKIYYVKVRSYKKAGSTKLYGPYSSVKKVKIK